MIPTMHARYRQAPFFGPSQITRSFCKARSTGSDRWIAIIWPKFTTKHSHLLLFKPNTMNGHAEWTVALYLRGSYRKSWATFFVCELGTADEGECGGRWNQLLCYPWVSCYVNSLHHVTSIIPNKMADNDMSFRQRAVIEFLVKEEIPAA